MLETYLYVINHYGAAVSLGSFYSNSGAEWLSGIPILE